MNSVTEVFQTDEVETAEVLKPRQEDVHTMRDKLP
jgi:hypothetical protein